MILHENCLPADDSNEISCLTCYFEKTAKFEIVVCCNLRVRINMVFRGRPLLSGILSLFQLFETSARAE